jgi:hypothetical protein
MLVEDGEWPLVVVHWPESVASEADAGEVLRLLTGFYGRPHAVLHDGLRAGGLSAGARRLVAAHTQRHEEEVRRWVVASAAAAPSAFTRALIKTIQWVAPPPTPFAVFASEREARDWLLQALRRAGLWRPAAG